MIPCDSCESKQCNSEPVTIYTDPACPPEVTIASSCEAPLYVVICEDLSPPKPTCDEELYPNIDTCTIWVRRTCTDPVTWDIVIWPIEEDTWKPVPSSYVALLECDEVTNLQNLVCYEIACDGTKEPAVIEPTTIPCDENCEVDIEYVCDEDADFQTAIITAIDPTTAEVKSEVRVVTDIPCDTTVRCQKTYRCNAATGFYDEVETCYDADWVVTTEVVTATTDVCTKETKDVELVCSSEDGRLLALCINKDTGETTLTELDGSPVADGSNGIRCESKTVTDECYQDADDDTIRYTKLTCYDKADPASTATVVWILPDGTTSTVQPENSVPCITSSSSITCEKDKFIEGWLDNTGTSFRHTNMNFKVTFNSCPDAEFTVASATSWSDQVTQISAGLASVMPRAQDVDAYCQGWCGWLNAPIVILDKMFARYTWFRVCPDDCYPVSVYYTSDQNPKGRELVLQFVESDEIYYDVCVDCEGNKEYRYAHDGETWAQWDIATPICPKPCVHEYPELPGAQCTYQTIEVCEISPEDEDAEGNLVPAEVVTPNVFIQYTICWADVTKYVYTLDAAWDQVEHELTAPNYYGDCDTLEPVEDPIECPENATWEAFTVQKQWTPLDNSLWTWAVGVNIGWGINANDSYVVDVEMSWGTVYTYTHVAWTSFFSLFRNFLLENIPCVDVSIICANRPKCPKDGSRDAPWGVNLPQEEMFALWYRVENCVWEEYITRAVVTDSSNPDWIGAYKETGYYKGPKETYYKAVTCDGNFYKDCDGNLVQAPCCACSVLSDEICFKDEFVAECVWEPGWCDYTSTAKVAGIDSVETSCWTIPVNETFSDITAWANSPEMQSAQATIQAFLDANGWGTVTLEYLSQSVITFTVVWSPCEIISFTHTSNPGPHIFEESNCVEGGEGTKALRVQLDDCSTVWFDEDFVDNCCCGSALINTGRGWIFDPRNWPFTLGTITGATRADFVLAATAQWVSVDFGTQFDAEGNPIQDASIVTICGADSSTLTYDSTLFEWGVTIELEQTCKKSLNVWFTKCALNDLANALKWECDQCPTDVVTDTVCNSEEQTINDVVVQAWFPIIRKTITEYNAVWCDCVVDSTRVTFFNFENPVQEFTEEVAFEWECDQSIDTVERCDANGNPIQVVTLVVNTPDGWVVQTTYADANGQPIPEPSLPLSICNPQVDVIKGCIDGRTWVLALQSDIVGKPAYDVSRFTFDDNGATELVGQRVFSCDCAVKKVCKIDEKEYCYDTSGFAFTCSSSTIDINTVITDLCGDSWPSIIPSTWDLCTVGWVRSSLSPLRCRTDYPEPTTDPAGLAAELLNFGSFGDENVNPLTSGNTTTNFYMAVRGTFPSLEGTTQNTISLTTTWEVGSGISIHAYDCATDNNLPLVSGTPTTFAADAACQDGTRWPIDAWGAANNGMTQTTVFDTSWVADLANVVFYSIVLNPPGDALLDVMVEGLTPWGSCNVTDVNTLAEILSVVTWTTWTVNGDIICTTTSDTLWALTCGAVSVDPVITDNSVDLEVPMVWLDPCTIAEISWGSTYIAIDSTCDAEGNTITPIVVITNWVIWTPLYVDSMGNQITWEIIEWDCACPCGEEEPIVKAERLVSELPEVVTEENLEDTKLKVAEIDTLIKENSLILSKESATKLESTKTQIAKFSAKEVIVEKVAQ